MQNLACSKEMKSNSLYDDEGAGEAAYGLMEEGLFARYPRTVSFPLCAKDSLNPVCWFLGCDLGCDSTMVEPGRAGRPCK